jgi:RNA polymerase sigma-70 factor (ECF subfamily)
MKPADSPAAESDEHLAAVAGRRGGPDREAAREACQELYRRHARRLLAFLAARVPRSDLEDVHQTVWVQVWKHLPGGFDGRNFRAWLYQIARNLVASHFRQRRPQARGAAGERADTRPSTQPLETLLERERRLLLEKCLARLESRLAELVRGRLAGETYDELCPRLGLTPAQGHKLFHTAKAALHDCVNQSRA